ncbi:MAG: thiamine pyrophosphate-binding protein [Spirochaetes bacterium]|nr:thiamine pyrophosphate-binding protein [Spirochaetota bacterium]
MIKVTDYLFQRLTQFGVRHIFMVSGGGAMHLNDSIGKCSDIEYICNHHEQACAIGAEGYARTSGRLGIVCVTTGPGGTNSLTGVIGQWLDSVPVLYLSGQVKFETTIESCRGLGLRQVGDQEINIVDIVRPVTKYAAIVLEPRSIRRLLEKAIYIATHGRPGPVWLDVPLNVQGAMVDEADLEAYDEREDRRDYGGGEVLRAAGKTAALLKGSARPVFVAGHGIRIAGARDAFLRFVERLGIPVVTTFNGFDLISTDHPLFIGRIGTIGTRAGNFALQNADLILSVGSRNNIRQVSYNWDMYGRGSKKVVVDIDEAELKKPTLRPDMAVHADAGEFLARLNELAGKDAFPPYEDWLRWCQERRERYPGVLPEQRDGKNGINPYFFIEIMNELLDSNTVLVAGNGTACVAEFQAGSVKEGQRIFWNSGCASMGYDLPAAIGACVANMKKTVVCLAGDGSLQMNIQELQTVHHYNLPIKLFYLNNGGYVSIKQTQDTYFEGRRVACDPASGVSFPNIIKIAAAYGIRSEVIDGVANMKEKIYGILSSPEAVICDVRLDSEYVFMPKLASERLPDGRLISKPLEDMSPFLSREEFKDNIINPKLLIENE